MNNKSSGGQKGLLDDFNISLTTRKLKYMNYLNNYNVLGNTSNIKSENKNLHN